MTARQAPPDGYLADIEAGLHIELERGEDELVLVLSGELDLATAGEFAVAVDNAMTGGPPRIAIDAARLTFIDSSGINALVRAHRRATAESVGLVVRAPESRVRTVLEITGIDAVLAIEP